MKTAPVSINKLLIPLNSPIEINALRHDSSIVEISDCVAALRDGTLGADIRDVSCNRIRPFLHLRDAVLDFLKSGGIDD
jgi:hypothetical protein